ncbi:MAG: hypothetical protein CVT92_13750 [Bacteroidetes bacterium HGW-Bacteroidetes-1]|jgi:hypothetical protein|nr:MAG: hypothetical protein CVT92_13750 [Bacteroidetes bacterium HGW-Bacteroidetes-1]
MFKIIPFIIIGLILAGCNSFNKEENNSNQQTTSLEEIRNDASPLAEMLRPKQVDFTLTINGKEFTMDSENFLLLEKPIVYYNDSVNVTFIRVEGPSKTAAQEWLSLKLSIDGIPNEGINKAKNIQLHISEISPEGINKSLVIYNADNFEVTLSNVIEKDFGDGIKAYTLEMSMNGKLFSKDNTSVAVSNGKLCVTY